jgi:DNA-binding CsgD family transcriptional regulator
MSQTSEHYLSESEARAIVHLLGEVAPIKGLTEQKRHLLTGITKIISADKWIWETGCFKDDGSSHVPVGILSDGWSPMDIQWGLKAVGDKLCRMPFRSLMSEALKRQTHATILRRDGEPDEIYFAGHYWLNYAKHAGLADLMMSVRRTSGSTYSFVGLVRGLGQPRFSERDRFIFHIIAAEVPWLFDAELPNDESQTALSLAPRQQLALIFLLQGDSAKQVAAKMNISQHTVADYVKLIYSAYGVSTRGELLAAFLSGGRTGKNDSPAHQ